MAKKKPSLSDAEQVEGEALRDVALATHLAREVGAVRVVVGDLTVKGDLVLDPPELGLLVDGDLTVKGDVLNRDPAGGAPLVVRGNLSAKNLLVGGAEVRVLGSATIRNTVYGHGGQGVRTIAGDLSAKALVAVGGEVVVEGTTLAPTVGVGEGYDFQVGDASCLNAAFLGPDGGVEHEALFDHCAGGTKSPLKSRAKSARVEVLRELERVVAERGVRSLDLKSMKLEAYPAVLDTLEGLEELVIPRFSRLPASLGALRDLRYLEMSGWSRSPIPAAVYELEGLEVLKLPYANPGATAPDGISALRALRVLSLAGSASVPADLAELPKLQQLSLRGISAQLMEAFPEEVLGLTCLEVLEVNEQQWTRIPDLSSLQELRVLSMARAFGNLETPPDLSVLPNLRVLLFDGYTGGTSSHPYGRPELAWAALRLPRLTHLDLRHWGTEGRKWHRRPEQTFTFPQDCFAESRSLEVLDLRDNGLTELPESLYELKHLRILGIDRTQLTLETRAKLRERLPDCRLVNEGIRLFDAQIYQPTRCLPIRGVDYDGDPTPTWQRLLLGDVPQPEGISGTVEVRTFARSKTAYNPNPRTASAWQTVATLPNANGEIDLGDRVGAADHVEYRLSLRPGRSGDEVQYPTTPYVHLVPAP